MTPAEGSATGILAADQTGITYDRASKMVSVSNADFTAVYDSLGAKVFQSDDKSFSLASLPAGVYVVKAGNSSIKIAR